MKNLPDSLQRLDDQSLSTIHGGMFRGARFAIKGTPLNPGPDPHDLYLAARQAEAKERFGTLTRANPGILAPPDPNWNVEVLKHRIATGYGQPQLRRP